MSKKEAVIVISDTHINSTFSMWPGSLQLDDGGHYKTNKVQQFLNWAWEETIKELLEKTQGMRRTLILNGDIGEMDSKARSWQTVQRLPSITVQAMKKIFYPVMDEMNDTFVIRGTEAHTGNSAFLETAFADHEHKSIVSDPMNNSSTWWHLRSEFGGVTFDITHHASMGGLPWSYVNAGNKLAIKTILEYYEWGEIPPDLAVRAHNHRFAESGENYPTRGVYGPGFQWKNAYLHRIGSGNVKPHIGALYFICKDGKYEMHKIIKEPRRANRWTRKNRSMDHRLLLKK